jgi:hypothetical protein
MGISPAGRRQRTQVRHDLGVIFERVIGRNPAADRSELVLRRHPRIPLIEHLVNDRDHLIDQGRGPGAHSERRGGEIETVVGVAIRLQGETDRDELEAGQRTEASL